MKIIRKRFVRNWNNENNNGENDEHKNHEKMSYSSSFSHSPSPLPRIVGIQIVVVSFLDELGSVAVDAVSYTKNKKKWNNKINHKKNDAKMWDSENKCSKMKN